MEGIGVLLSRMGGGADEDGAFAASIGKTIKAVAIDDPHVADEAAWRGKISGLRIDFTDGTAIVLRDEGQSCCEARWIHTDDDLGYHVGATLLSAEIADAPSIPDPDDPEGHGGGHEVQFLRVKTSNGVIVCETHVNHNGYYGGFSLVVRGVKGKSPVAAEEVES